MGSGGFPRLFDWARCGSVPRLFWLVSPVDKSVTSRIDRITARARQARRAAPSRLSSARPSSRSTSRSRRRRRSSPGPCRCGNARRSRSRADRAAADSEPGETVDDRLAAELRAPAARARRAHRAAAPNGRAGPVSANIGGGRSGSPSGRSLGHSSIGSASSSTRPPPPHPVVERDQILGRLRRGCAISSSRPLASSAGLGDADRHDAIARLQRRAAPASRCRSSEKSSPNTSGRLVSSSSVGRWPRPRPRATSARRAA